VLQRACACGTHTAGGGECESCKRKRLQRFGTESAPDLAPPIVHEVLRASGQPLEPATRAALEPRFGHDFSRVRVHTDAHAAASARAVNALAYTVGSHVAFGSGRYAPGTPAGDKLIAHELAHVVQQRGAPTGEGELLIDPSPTAEREATEIAARGAWDRQTGVMPHLSPSHALARALQRGTDHCSGAGATCAAPDACAQPDVATSGNGASTRWEIEINIDIERDDWETAARKQEFGHTYVRFWESNGREFTYGFYPAGAVPNENVRHVPGCIRHPDRTHDACIDDVVSFSLTQEQYNAGLALAQQICRSGRSYGQSYTCTTFAEEVARAAGQSLPSSSSRPTTIFYQAVPAIDNPNTLIEKVRESRGALSDDDGVRAWVRNANPTAISALGAAEKVRMIGVLMEGWISSDDMVAMRRLLRGVTTRAEAERIRAAITPRLLEFTDLGQRTQMRVALSQMP
jgi:hypothetical protein